MFLGGCGRKSWGGGTFRPQFLIPVFNGWKCGLGYLKAPSEKNLWVSLLYVVLWSFWNIRNIMVFEKATIHWSQELYQIKLRLGFRMKGWASDCPYNPTDLVCNLEGVSSWSKHLQPSVYSLWEPPPSKSWKWNEDCSARGKPGPTSIEGVLRDDKGKILANSPPLWGSGTPLKQNS